jgi:uncharacterized protein DUF1565/Big-like domain-containing protein
MRNLIGLSALVVMPLAGCFGFDPNGFQCGAQGQCPAETSCNPRSHQCELGGPFGGPGSGPDAGQTGGGPDAGQTGGGPDAGQTGGGPDGGQTGGGPDAGQIGGGPDGGGQTGGPVLSNLATVPISPSPNANPTVTGNTNELVSSVTLYAQAGCTGSSYGTVAPTTTSFSVAVGGAGVPHNQESSIYVKAVDAAGQATCGSVTYRHDNQAPAAPSIGTTPNTADPAHPTQNRRPTVGGSAEPGSTVTLYASAACGTELASVDVNPTSGVWTYTLTADVVADGTTSFSARATDAAGNSGPCSVDVAYYTDNTAPTATISNPPAAVDLTGNATFTLGGTDPNGSTSTLTPTCSLDGAVVVCTLGAFTFPRVGPGPHTLSFTLRDAAGNLSQPVSYQWLITRYINNATGSDAAGQLGTGVQPFKTIAHGLSGAQSGEIVVVNGGTGASYDASHGEVFPLTIPAGVTLERDPGVNTAPTIAGNSAAATVIAVGTRATLGGLTGSEFTVSFQADGGTAIAVTGTDAKVRGVSMFNVPSSGRGTGIAVMSGAGNARIENNGMFNLLSGTGFSIAASALLQRNAAESDSIGISIQAGVAADLGSSSGSVGQNNFSCNQAADAVFKGTGTFSALNNLWDHAPPDFPNGPTRGTTCSASIDICTPDGAQVLADGASLTPCGNGP